MNNFTMSFKQKIGFVSFLVLTSLACTQVSFAMDVDQPSKKRLRDEEGDSQGKKKARRENGNSISSSDSSASSSSSSSFSSSSSPMEATNGAIIALDDVNHLIDRAKTNNVEAQNQLIELYYTSHYVSYLSPGRICFFDWEDIQGRCLRNSSYTYYAVKNFDDLPKLHVKKLLDKITLEVINGSASAQVNLAFMYAKGLGVEKDDKEACRLYTLAADQGNALAQNGLGVMYGNGQGVEKDEKKAIEFYTLATEQGLAKAQYNLGWMYENGRGVEKNETKAIEYYTLAANQGFALAQNNLAFMYENGKGVEKNETKAIEYYTLAANQGFALAQNNLAFMYENGKGVEKNETKAIEYYTLAANQGFALAQNNLGFMYENGKGVEKNETKAIEYYTLAANQGVPEAQNKLGWMYAHGLGVQKDEKEAYRLYTLAANQGNVLAQNNLGWMYAKGLGVQKDEKEACRLYTLAADQGNALAQYNLGWMYENGIGVEKDEKEACRLYTPAADQGVAKAQKNLGWMYAKGLGVEKDEKEACRLYTLAANQGNAQAQYNLGWMYENGIGVEKDEKEACRLYTLAANQGDARAQTNLGLMYEIGQGVEKDDKEAYRLYKLAADQGVPEAQNNLAWMYTDGRGVEKNTLEGLCWIIKSKQNLEVSMAGFIHTHLPRNPNVFLNGDSFQAMLNEIIQGKSEGIDEKGGLHFLINKFQQKTVLNNKNGSFESKYAIPTLGEKYKPIEELIVEAMNMMQSLLTIKPGFMVTAVKLSDDAKQYLDKQITPFFSLHKIESVDYLTFGEENVRLANTFAAFIIAIDEKFDEAMKQLQNIAHIYEQALDSELGQLMVSQCLVHASTDRNNCIEQEDGSRVQVKEYFKGVVSEEESKRRFEDQEKKYTDLKEYLRLPLQEIKDECDFLLKLKDTIKSLPSHGVGSRNQDILNEYPLL